MDTGADSYRRFLDGDDEAFVEITPWGVPAFYYSR